RPHGAHPCPAVRAPPQAVRSGRRRDHAHQEGAPQRHRRPLRTDHQRTRPGTGRAHDGIDDHLPGRHRGPALPAAADLRLLRLRAARRPRAPQGLEWSQVSTFVTLLIIGLSEGAILALAALGFVLIYKATGVINFAQGEFLLIGAYSFYTAFVLM